MAERPVEELGDNNPNPNPYYGMTADVHSWSISGTGLTLRDKDGNKLGTLKLIITDPNPQAQRDKAMKLVKYLSELIYNSSYTLSQPEAVPMNYQDEGADLGRDLPHDRVRN